MEDNKKVKSSYLEQAGNFLTAYTLEQRKVVSALAKQDMTDPRIDITYRHECDKLYLLESIMIDAGANIKRTVDFKKEKDA